MIFVGIIIGFLFGCGVGFILSLMAAAVAWMEEDEDTDPQPGDIIPGIANVDERA